MASETTTTAFGRLLQYCTSHRIPMPSLEYDGDELTLSPGLAAFCQREGISLNWLVMGKEPVAAAEKAEIHKVMGRLSREDQLRILGALRDHQANGGRLEDVLRRHGFTV